METDICNEEKQVLIIWWAAEQEKVSYPNWDTVSRLLTQKFSWFTPAISHDTWAFGLSLQKSVILHCAPMVISCDCCIRHPNYDGRLQYSKGHIIISSNAISLKFLKTSFKM